MANAPTHAVTPFNLTSEATRDLPRAFGGPVLRALADHGTSPELATLLRQTVPERRNRLHLRLRDWYSRAYRHLVQQYQVEYVFKNSLTREILRTHHHGPDVRVFEEFPLGRQVADLLVVNGTSTIYEIKTAYDSLDRLPAQLGAYSQVAEFVYVVATASRIAGLVETLPPGVGLLVLTERGRLTKILEPQSNRDRLDPLLVFDCLRMAEYEDIVRRRCPAGPTSTTSATSYAGHRPYFRELSSAVVHAESVHAWGTRPFWPELPKVLRRVPAALVHALVAARLNRRQLRSFPQVLDLPLLEVA